MELLRQRMNLALAGFAESYRDDPASTKANFRLVYLPPLVLAYVSSITHTWPLNEGAMKNPFSSYATFL